MFNKFMRECFAMFEVRDDNGTRQYCWTYQESMKWLPYCSNYAAIFHRKTGQILVWRMQEQIKHFKHTYNI